MRKQYTQNGKYVNYVHSEIPPKLMKKFREKVFQKKGFKRGSLKNAVIEAIELWIEKAEEE